MLISIAAVKTEKSSVSEKPGVSIISFGATSIIPAEIKEPRSIPADERNKRLRLRNAPDPTAGPRKFTASLDKPVTRYINPKTVNSNMEAFMNIAVSPFVNKSKFEW
jgi:hypothetical protein